MREKIKFVFFSRTHKIFVLGKKGIFFCVFKFSLTGIKMLKDIFGVGFKMYKIFFYKNNAIEGRGENFKDKIYYIVFRRIF